MVLMHAAVERWSSRRPLRPPLLAPGELQPVATDDVRWRNGADA